jgi:hypothetical protein
MMLTRQVPLRKTQEESDKLLSGIPFKKYSLKGRGINFLDIPGVSFEANDPSVQVISYAYPCVS